MQLRSVGSEPNDFIEMLTRSANTLSLSEVNQIRSFLGYGNLDAPIWFVGLEEGLGAAAVEDCEHNLRARAGFHRTMDLHEAHLLLHEHGKPIDLENEDEKKTFTAVWLWMAKIVLARKSGHRPAGSQEVKEYVRTKLGRSKEETFLTELSPIPRKRARRESGCFEVLGEWSADDEKQRAIQIHELLTKFSPSIVICYGYGKSAKFADALGICWQEDTNTRIKKSVDSRYLLLPFFGNGQMSHEVLDFLLQRGLLGGRP